MVSIAHELAHGKPRERAATVLADLLEYIEGHVEHRVLERLRREGVLAAAAEEYRSTGPLPPGVSRRTMREACARGDVPGARKEGRTWICSRRAWHEARTTAKATAKLKLLPPVTSDDELADSFLKAAGVRTTTTRRAS